jgi:hypothetical protein
LEKRDDDKVLKELHDIPARGHFASEAMAPKILRVGCYLLILFRDVPKDNFFYQMRVGHEKKPTIPLQPIITNEPFE